MNKCKQCEKKIAPKRQFCGIRCLCLWNSYRIRDLKLNPQAGSHHSQWKGDNASYKAIHVFMLRNYGRPDKCEWCGYSGLTKDGVPNIEWANKSGQYSRKREDWLWLCAKCHKKQEKSLKNKRLQSPHPKTTQPTIHSSAKS